MLRIFTKKNLLNLISRGTFKACLFFSKKRGATHYLRKKFFPVPLADSIL